MLLAGWKLATHHCKHLFELLKVNHAIFVLVAKLDQFEQMIHSIGLDGRLYIPCSEYIHEKKALNDCDLQHLPRHTRFPEVSP